MKPLAEQLRPQTLDQYLGQEHLVGQNGIAPKLRYRKITLHCPLGTPGVGKTTLALLLAKELEAPLYQLSAVSAGVKDVREVLATAEKSLLTASAPYYSSMRFIVLTKANKIVCSTLLNEVGSRSSVPLQRIRLLKSMQHCFLECRCMC